MAEKRCVRDKKIEALVLELASVGFAGARSVGASASVIR
jgi:hypothetical protein